MPPAEYFVVVGPEATPIWLLVAAWTAVVLSVIATLAVAAGVWLALRGRKPQDRDR